VAFDPEAITMADRFDIDARVYVEGRISNSEWTGNNVAKRHYLSVMSWHCRLPHIGRNRPKRDKQARRGEPVGAELMSRAGDAMASRLKSGSIAKNAIFFATIRDGIG
jgi:single-stranded DNA-binding protein